MRSISKFFSFFFLAGILFFGLGTACEAAGPNGGYGYQLTPEQMATVQKIFTDNYAGMDATRQALTAKRAELDAQLANPNPDMDKIESLSREIGELRGKMLAARANVRSQLAKQGLPAEVYGPDGQQGYWGRDQDVWQGQGWHGRRHGGRHHGPYGYGGMMGMMGGCGPCGNW